MLTAEENIKLPLSVAGEKIDPEWFSELSRQGRPRRPARPPARGALRGASSSASPSRARSSRGRRSSSPTSRPGNLDTQLERRDPRAPPRAAATDLRPDDRDGDPRPARRRDRRPDPLPRRRADRPSTARDATEAEVLKTMNELGSLTAALSEAAVIRVDAQGSARPQAPARPDLARDRARRRRWSAAPTSSPTRSTPASTRLFGVAYANADAVVTGKAVFGDAGDAERACVPRLDARADRAASRRRSRRRRRPGAGADRRTQRQGRSRAEAQPGSASASTPAATRFTPLEARHGTLAGGRRTRSRSTHETADAAAASRSASRVGVIVKGGQRAAVHGQRHRRLRQLDLARRRDDRRLRPADGADAVRQGGPARPDRRRREAGRLERGRSLAQIRTGAAAAHPGAHRRRSRRRPRSTTISSAPRHLPLLPARLRRHRPLRRRVRDREHALDHRRPADARVRDAARDRRERAAGAPRRGRSRGS